MKNNHYLNLLNYNFICYLAKYIAHIQPNIQITAHTQQKTICTVCSQQTSCIFALKVEKEREDIGAHLFIVSI